MQPNHPILSGLVKLHADLGGRIFENRKLGEKLAQDMKHVEAVIRMFEPSFDVRKIAIKRRQQGNPWFKRGTVFRHAVDVLRTATEPVIPFLIDQNLCAQSRSPMDMILQG